MGEDNSVINMHSAVHKTLFGKFKARTRYLKQETLSVWYASMDERTPWYARVLALLVAAYAFSPVDLIPDFIPFLGYLDDLILIPAGVTLTLKLIPTVVMQDACLKAAESLQKPVNWWMAVLIFIVWGITLFFIIRASMGLVIEYNEISLVNPCTRSLKCPFRF